MNLADKGRRAMAILRSEGLASLWFRILGEFVYRRIFLFERFLDAEPAAPASQAVAVGVSLLQPSELDEYIAFRSDGVASEIRSRLENGHYCFIARQHGAMASVVWAATGSAWTHYLEREIRLRPDEAYIYDSYTAPSFRRRNITSARSAVMRQYFRQRSFHRLLALVVPENAGGIGSAVKSGYHRAGVMGWVKIGRWRRDFCHMAAGACPVLLGERSPKSAAYTSQSQNLNSIR